MAASRSSSAALGALSEAAPERTPHPAASAEGLPAAIMGDGDARREEIVEEGEGGTAFDGLGFGSLIASRRALAP